MLPRSSLSWHPSASSKAGSPTSVTAAETVLDSLGTDELQEVNVDSLKWRFFEMGIRVGIALQMLLMCLLLILSSNEAIDELSKLYYPLFRGVFLLSFFGVLFALMLFAWKRTVRRQLHAAPLPAHPLQTLSANIMTRLAASAGHRLRFHLRRLAPSHQLPVSQRGLQP